MITSEILEKLKPELDMAAELINGYVGLCPIIIKHHADCDGYMGAIAIELAIAKLLDQKKKSSWRNLKRTPCKTPYYSYYDVVKDLSIFQKEIAQGKPPLVIILDNGSSTQDVLAIKKAKLYGLKVIVVDHHKPSLENGKAVIANCVDVFINPYLVGGDSNFTAGMLGVELSQLLFRTGRVEHLPAIAGFADHAKGEDFNKYVNLAIKKGYNEENLKLIAKCVDFEAYHIGFMESKLVEDLVLSSNPEKIKLIIKEIELREDAIIKSADIFTTIKKKDDLKIITFDTASLERGKYPSQGKATGILFRHFTFKNEESVVLMGVGENSITFRTNLKGFDVNSLIRYLENELPKTRITGGGHEFAGTIHFIDTEKQEIISKTMQYIKK